MIRWLGRAAVGFLAEAGGLWRMAVAAADRFFCGPFRGQRARLRAPIVQAVRAGFDSLPLVALISLLMGMIMALQSAYQLDKLGALSLVANLVGIAVTRELAPLMTGIVVAGRYGSSIAAELGTMKISQEVDALTVMGIDPTSYLVVPRLLALAVALPCLTVFADLVGILGGLVVGVWALQMAASSYLLSTIDALQLEDILTGMIKALAFAAIIGLVSCRQGLRAGGGAQGVGRATTSSVVLSIVLMIAGDLFVTALFYVRG